MQVRESGEDYLEAILMLKNRIGVVHSIDVVNHLGFSKPSISNAMKKLRESGYIEIEGGHIELTETGLAIATDIYEKHNLLARFLISLGVSEGAAFEDACKIEHDLSRESFERLKEFCIREGYGK